MESNPPGSEEFVTSQSPLRRTTEKHTIIGGDPEIGEETQRLEHQLANAISRTESISGGKGVILPHKEETVLTFLEGANELLENLYGGKETADEIVSPEKAQRRADFVRLVQKRIGTVNPDGSVDVKGRPNLNVTSNIIRVHPRTGSTPHQIKFPRVKEVQGN